MNEQLQLITFPEPYRIEVIDLWPPWADCTICEEPTPLKFGIARYEDVIVPDDYEGEWGGSPVCERCNFVVIGMQRKGRFLTFAEVRRVVKGPDAGAGES